MLSKNKISPNNILFSLANSNAFKDCINALSN